MIKGQAEDMQEKKLKKIKGYLRCSRNKDGKDLFFEYQQGNMSKGKLLEHIINVIRNLQKI